MSTIADSMDSSFDSADDSVLSTPVIYEPVAQWARENAMRLEEKEKREKEILKQIIEEAEEYKDAFYKKRVVSCENKKLSNRESELLFMENNSKFYAEADKDYWKAIAELLPNEVPTVGKNKGKKDQEKKPSIVITQGPKPGKPTDLSRMRQVLQKLKQDTPNHLNLSPATSTPSKDINSSNISAPPIAETEVVASA